MRASFHDAGRALNHPLVQLVLDIANSAGEHEMPNSSGVVALVPYENDFAAVQLSAHSRRAIDPTRHFILAMASLSPFEQAVYSVRPSDKSLHVSLENEAGGRTVFEFARMPCAPLYTEAAVRIRSTPRGGAFS